MEKLIRFDWAMQHLLRNEVNFDILEGFLSAMLREEVRMVRLLEDEHTTLGFTNKLHQVDLLAETDKGEQIVVGIQAGSESAFLRYLPFSSAQLVLAAKEPRQPYGMLKKVILIGIAYDDIGEGDDYVYYGSTTFAGRHEAEASEADKTQEKAFGLERPSKIFPQFYLIRVDAFPDEVKNAMDEWIYLLKHRAVKPEFQSKEIQAAATKLHPSNLSPEERRAYDEFLVTV